MADDLDPLAAAMPWVNSTQVQIVLTALRAAGYVVVKADALEAAERERDAAEAREVVLREAGQALLNVAKVHIPEGHGPHPNPAYEPIECMQAALTYTEKDEGLGPQQSEGK
jgi:hypothetical protein